MNADVTHDRLREVLHYDPATGVFTWRGRYGRMSAGQVAGGPNGTGYVIVRVDGVNYRAHRLAWFYMTGEWPKEMIDHKNGRRDDNRFENLREATRSQNNANRRSTSRCGLKGATFNPIQGQWAAQIKVNGKPIYLGWYNTAEEAHAAYVAAAEKHFGEFARAA